MDPQQTKCYAKAQKELRELFREISSQGQVSGVELQHALLPFTAGDVKNDVLELIDDMKHKQATLDEQEFIRVMWKRMYWNNVTHTDKYRSNPRNAAIDKQPKNLMSSSTEGTGDMEDDGAVFNIPLAHVIVSIKRRSQLKHFADYYASRGISGADHLTAEKSGGGASGASKGSPRHARSPRHDHRRRACLGRNTAIPVSSLRERASSSYEAVACVFDSEERIMRTLTLFPRGVRAAHIVNCSRLYCLLFSKDAGSYILGSSHFARQVHHAYANDMHRKKCASQGVPLPAAALPPNLPASVSQREDILIMTKLEDLGLRNVLTAASSSGTFVACTERKVHQWVEQVSNSVSSLDPPLDVTQDEELTSLDMEDQESSSFIDLEGEGDCFGLLGGKKLLARTKNIADVSFIKQLAAGDNFAMAVTSSGELFAWGSALLGHSERSPWKVPWLLSEKVTRIACGMNHVVVVTQTGCAYSWGSNLYGQLGHGKNCSIKDPPVSEPVAIKLPYRHPHSVSGSVAVDSSNTVLDAACGDDHSVLLVGAGDIYCFGNNWQGQLGLHPGIPENGCVHEPTRVVLPARGDSPSQNERDYAGPPHGRTVVPPSPSARVYLISAFGSTTAAVTTQEEVFIWGQCVPSGAASVCGLVARWEPQLVDVSMQAEEEEEEEEEGRHEKQHAPSTMHPKWQNIALANGLIVLTKHG